MSGVIAVPAYEPWLVKGLGFRTLLERALNELENEEDIYKLRQALVLSGLHFDLMPTDQAFRIAVALNRVSQELRTELRKEPASNL